MNKHEVTTPTLLPLLAIAATLAACTSSAPDDLEPESDAPTPRAESLVEIAVHGECIADGVSLSIATDADHPPDPGLEVEWTLVEGPSDGCLVGDGPFARLAVNEPGVYVVQASINGNSDETGWAEVEIGACDDEDTSAPTCLGSIAVPGGEDLDPETYGKACACDVQEGLDADEDGTPDAEDLCPDTVLESSTQGCSVAQLLAEPDILTRQLATEVSAIEDELLAIGEEAGLESLVEPAQILSEVREALLAHQLRIEQGQPCEAIGPLTMVDKQVAYIAETLASPSEEILQYAAGIEPPSEEAIAGTMFMVRLRGIADRTAGLLEGFEAPASSTEALCESTEANTAWEGVVVDTPDARGLVELDDGRFVRIPGDSAPIAEGMFVAVEGNAIGDVLVASSAEVLEGAATLFNGDPVDLPCLELGIAPPIQRFDPGQPASVVHDASGYIRTSYLAPNALHLEEGGRFAVRSNGCKEVFGQTRALRITGQYSSGPHVIANALRPNSESVAIPFLRNNGQLESVDVELIEQKQGNCVPGPCVQTTVTHTESYDVARVHRGSTCELDFDREVFELHQSSPSFYQRAVLTGFVDKTGFPSMFSGTNATANAEGYLAQEQLLGSQLIEWSSYPMLHPIAQGEGVAVYDEPLVSPPFSFAQTGALAGSPVHWPHVSGHVNGSDYAFSCMVPDLVKDRIADCGAFPALMDTYYGLPWSFFQGWVETTQGNLSPQGFSHEAGSDAQFAFDFDLPMTSFVLAARPGKVTKVFEDEWRGQPNCLDMLDNGFPMCSDTNIPPIGSVPPFGVNGWACVPVANVVVIEHDDGTESIYAHFNVAGVIVEVGDEVERGDILGLSGTTGCSTGPHLHFEQRDASNPGAGTEPITFGGYYTPVWPPQPQLQVCMNPVKGAMLQSTLF